MHKSKQQKTARTIPLADKVGYGAGNLTFGVILQIISTYMVFYSTVILNIPGSIIGLVIGISVFWDAVSDPIMGHISDHTHSAKYGRRHLYILSGSIAIARITANEPIRTTFIGKSLSVLTLAFPPTPLE